jgi:hypothetical protein
VENVGWKGRREAEGLCIVVSALGLRRLTIFPWGLMMRNITGLLWMLPPQADVLIYAVCMSKRRLLGDHIILTCNSKGEVLRAFETRLADRTQILGSKTSSA